MGGKDRYTEIAQTIREREEMVIEGVQTTYHAERAILRNPDFSAVTHSTKWVEETLDLSKLVSSAGGGEAPEDGLIERSTTVEVNGKRFDVKMWVPEFTAGVAKKSKKPTRGSGSSGGALATGDVAAPMQGTIVKVNVEVGPSVAVGYSNVMP